jgi:hypothetical protein
LLAAIFAGIVAIYKSRNDTNHIEQSENQKNKPLMRNTESTQEFMGRHISSIPFALALVLVLILLAEYGVV